MFHRRAFLVCVAAAGLLIAVLRPAAAQNRLPGMPGYANYQAMLAQTGGGRGRGSGGVVTGGTIANLRWEAGGQGFTYTKAGQAYRFDLASRQATATGPAPAAPGRGRGRGPGMAPGAGGCPQVALERGRQADCEASPDGQYRALFRAEDAATGRYGNVILSRADGSDEKALTTDGNDKTRLKYGKASWVYGEELSQTTAIWWSPDSKKVAFYRFDESKVKDFYIATDQTHVQDTLNVEAYPKPGMPNPQPDILVYDLASGKTTRLDVRDGQPFSDSVVGHYVWDIHWAPDSTQIYLNRANRRQQIVDFTACGVATGACHTIVREAWPSGWINTDGGPNPVWLQDHKRFLWMSARTGWDNVYLYDVSGRLLAQLTHADGYEVAGLIKLDEAANVLFYTARDGDNYLKVQLHRVRLDGKNDVRLTDPRYTHSFVNCGVSSTAGAYADPAAGGGRGGAGGPVPCDIAPDNRYIVDAYQTHDQPPATQLLDADGKPLAQLTQSDMTRFQQLGFRTAEQYSYLAADGKTTLYGQVVFPAHFDPAKKYPALLSVYGGPIAISQVTTENFAGPNPVAEYGFLMVTVSYRGTFGLGKRSADQLYEHLGVAEMDDMALGVKALWSRPWFDQDRVGIYGTSYGGYTSAMQIVRHPEVFAAASASSPPTDWRNYDSVYSERYMWIPSENQAGYAAGAAATYAKDLQGRLLLYYGTADNNVHNTNVLQFIQALQQAGKNFDVQVGPDRGHSGVNNARMMEFFIRNLVMDPQLLRAPAAANAVGQH